MTASAPREGDAAGHDHNHHHHDGDDEQSEGGDA
jgi:hypothetical protein